jgi:UDP-N-acetylglucosamine 2-epimerase (non-hydrolysing)
MKLAPVYKALQQRIVVHQMVVHTGQHYERNLSDVFFCDLGLPKPEMNLQVGSGSHAQQTAAIMARFEPALQDCKPDLVLVYGDVNSTAAATLVCAKLQIPIGHVEAGLRSFDRRMPEEINRVVTDALADLLLTPSQDGNENLLREGVDRSKIFYVGNVMIDALVQLLPSTLGRRPPVATTLGLRGYGLVTLHRPSNVDRKEVLFGILEALDEISRDLPLVFPVHPRTGRQLEGATTHFNSRLHFIEPLGYVDFLALEQGAKVVITDSGGIQEETTYLGVPCLTLRENTERPVTVRLGTNILVGHDTNRLKEEVGRILAGNAKKGSLPPLWDGNAASRTADVILGSWSRCSYPEDSARAPESLPIAIGH